MLGAFPDVGDRWLGSLTDGQHSKSFSARMSTDNPKYTKQPTLPGIDFAPKKVRKHGLQETHSYPLVSNGKEPTEGRFHGFLSGPCPLRLEVSQSGDPICDCMASPDLGR